jgi:hypothetical protein
VPSLKLEKPLPPLPREVSELVRFSLYQGPRNVPIMTSSDN